MTHPAPNPITFPLRLRRTLTRGRVRAYFIPGDDVSTWLSEMCGWGIPIADASLYVLPRDLQNRTPAGALVVPREATEVANAKVRLAVPYSARAGERLFIPADAQLDPEVPDDELARCCRHAVQVLHPITGLVGFGAEDTLAIESLLKPPPRNNANWDRAVPGIVLPSRLIEVIPAAPPGVESIIDEGRDDIGSLPPDDLPPTNEESTLGTAAARAAKPVISMAEWVREQFRRSSAGVGAAQSGPAGGSSGQGWLQRARTAVDRQLQQRRHRELHRLMDLLRRDPDAGLKRALPLRDMQGGRGRARPGATLGNQPNIDFSFSLIGGGHAADPWDVPPDLQQALRAQYRDAANRELDLGRFRRSAYILAHLLGDFSAAADALKRGRHFREAATLYKDHLNNPRAAALCLAEGGLVMEAIPIYEQLGETLKVAELYERIGQHDEAQRCYREAANDLVARGHPLEASRLLETKLDAPDEALDVLAGAWPASDNSGACLREWFTLTGRLGRHHLALSKLRQLQEPDLERDRPLLPFVQALVAVARIYPDPVVRDRAADDARVVIAERLTATAELGVRSLAHQLATLAPHDRLLSRDVDRFVNQTVPTASPKPPPARARPEPDAPLEEFHLPTGNWLAAAPTDDGLVAIAHDDRALLLVRANWQGKLQRISRLPVRAGEIAVMLSKGSDSPHVGVAPFRIRLHRDPFDATFAASNDFAPSVQLRMPTWLVSKEVLGYCRGKNHANFALAGRDATYLTLAAHIGDPSQLAFTRDVVLSRDGLGAIDAPIPMFARELRVYMAYRNRVLIAGPLREQDQWVPLPHVIRALAPAGPDLFIATQEEGGVLAGMNGQPSVPFGHGMARPVANVTDSGVLVAATRNAVLIRQIVSGSLEQRAAQQVSDLGADPIAVLPAGARHVAVLSTLGQVRTHRLG